MSKIFHALNDWRLKPLCFLLWKIFDHAEKFAYRISGMQEMQRISKHAQEPQEDGSKHFQCSKDGSF